MRNQSPLIREFAAAHPWLKDEYLAHGLCFWACLAFAQWASEDKIKIMLVRWTVIGDRHFNEHWAIALRNDQVLDFTRAQVDGKIAEIYSIDDYPDHYCKWRLYPADLFLDEFIAMPKRARMTDTFLLSTKVKIAKYDLDNYPTPPLTWLQRIYVALMSTAFCMYVYWIRT